MAGVKFNATVHVTRTDNMILSKNIVEVAHFTVHENTLAELVSKVCTHLMVVQNQITFSEEDMMMAQVRAYTDLESELSAFGVTVQRGDDGGVVDVYKADPDRVRFTAIQLPTAAGWWTILDNDTLQIAEGYETYRVSAKEANDQCQGMNVAAGVVFEVEMTDVDDSDRNADADQMIKDEVNEGNG